MLQRMFGTQIPDDGPLTVPTPQSAAARAKQELEALPHDQLVDQMLRLQTKFAKQKGAERKEEASRSERGSLLARRRGSSSQQTEKCARDLTENWVKQHSRKPSKESDAKPNTKSKTLNGSKKKKETKDEWKQTAWEGGVDWSQPW